MISGNSKTSDSHRLLLNLSNKRDLIAVINMLFYKTLAYTIYRKIQKSHIKTTHLKYQLQRGMMNLNYLVVHILYQIFKTILSILS